MNEKQEAVPVPQTLEGWYTLHDVYTIDWPKWRAVEAGRREELAKQVADWLKDAAAAEGDTAAYSVLTQKGDLMLVHYRRSPDDLNRVELSLRQLGLYEYLWPAYSYFSVIEVSVNEVTAMAHKKLAEQGLTPGSESFDTALAAEMEIQQKRVEPRLFGPIPEHKYICFYPMNKRRGEQVNWYTLDAAERRQMMRGHGRIGHKYHQQVKQVIGGSIGLDDWEWGVSLHANDMLPFKKLIHEMRFDPASALFAEFGPFYLGIRRGVEQIADLLAGRLS
ncbi:MAG: heme-dependent peroxidase [Planctomycetes bacterium]|nr:heme-dependent peroxidase [Planctomycetota bacterium]